MRALTGFVVASQFFVLGACASAVPQVDFYATDSESLRRFQTVTLLDGEETSGLQELAEVRGLYCRKSLNDAATTEPVARLHAIDQVKLKVAIMGARYVGVPACEASEKGDMTNNCIGTVVCTAPVFADRGE